MNLSLNQQEILSNYEKLAALDNDSRVWLIRDRQSNELFVRKDIVCESPNIYRRLIDAAIPGIPRIIYIFSCDCECTLIEEYIHGVTIDKYIKEQADKEECVKSLTVELCHILSQLHQSSPPIIVRDIKPSNIIVSNDMPYIVDFNIARLYEYGRNEDTHLLGSVEYAAPEQYGFGQTDARTDIYSLAVTMNVLLTDHFPKDMLPPAPLDSVIAKAISIDPADRYENAKEFANAIVGSDNTHQPHNLSSSAVCRLRRPTTYIAIVLYSLWIFLLVQNMNYSNADGTPGTSLQNCMARIILFLITFIPYLYNGNYFRVLDYTVGKYRKNKLKYWLMRMIYTLLFSISIPLILVLVFY